MLCRLYERKQSQGKPGLDPKGDECHCKAKNTLSKTKAEVAALLSKDGEGYLPMRANVVERAMTLYDETSYAEPDAIIYPEWQSGRIDFQPWPFPSATLIVNELKNTLVDRSTFPTRFRPGLCVVDDLVDYGVRQKSRWRNIPVEECARLQCRQPV